jgi:nucleoside-diphosphate-sugar epimerase
MEIVAMRALVTGAAGFIGYHTAARLLNRGDDVVLVDNFARGETDGLYRQLMRHPRATALALDLADPAAAQALPGDVDMVFHMAALNGTQNFYERPLDVLRCSTLPAFTLLERYRNTGLSRFVYAGSGESYAATVTRFGWPVPTAEDVPLCIDDPFNPRWSYAISKMHGEVLTIQGCRQLGLPFTVVRYHNVYGPRMGDKHVVPDFLNRARDGVFALYGHADTRTMIYIDDAVAATIALAETPEAAGEVVNVGGTEEIGMAELGRRIMQVCGFTGDIVLHPSPRGSVARRAPDVSKLQRLTGLAETVTLEAGLARTASFYLGHPVTAEGLRPVATA